MSSEQSNSFSNDSHHNQDDDQPFAHMVPLPPTKRSRSMSVATDPSLSTSTPFSVTEDTSITSWGDMSSPSSFLFTPDARAGAVVLRTDSTTTNIDFFSSMDAPPPSSLSTRDQEPLRDFKDVRTDRSQDPVEVDPEGSLQPRQTSQPPEDDVHREQVEQGEEEGQLKNDELEAAWQAFVEQHGGDRPPSATSGRSPSEPDPLQTIRTFLPQLEQCRQAERRFQQVYQEVADALTDHARTTVLEKWVVPLHDQWVEELQVMEGNLIRHFVHNHELRRRLGRHLDQARASWEAQYDQWKTALVTPRANYGQGDTFRNNNTTEENQVSHSSELVDPYENGEKGDAAAKDGKVTTRHDDETLVGDGALDSANNMNDEGDLEPNWEELLQDECSREAIQTFLQSRHRWQAAQDEFANVLDDAVARIDEGNQRTFGIIEEAYHTIMDPIHAQERALKLTIMDNFHRRARLEAHIEEAAKAHQGLLAKLFGLVAGRPIPPVPWFRSPPENSPKEGKRDN